MGILILTGPPASGKNSIAPHIAKQRNRCAIIDVDQVRWMLVQPHAAPWEGEEGKRQMHFGVENACLLATRFADAGNDVIILDFLWDYTSGIYQDRLAAYHLKIIQLMPTRAEILRRNVDRGGWLPPHEVEMLYDFAQAMHSYDLQIDNTSIPFEHLATRLAAYLDEPST